MTHLLQVKLDGLRANRMWLVGTTVRKADARCATLPGSSGGFSNPGASWSVARRKWAGEIFWSNPTAWLPMGIIRRSWKVDVGALADEMQLTITLTHLCGLTADQL